MQRFSGLQLRSLSVNTLTQFIVRIVSSVSSLIATLIIAYFLGFEAVGSFTKVVTFVSLFYLFLDFGFNSILLKDYFKNVETKLGNIILLRLIIALVLIPLITVLATTLPHNALTGTGFSDFEKMGITIFSFVLIGMGIINGLQALLQRRLIYQRGIVPGLVSSVVVILGVLYGIYSENFLILFVSYVFASAVQAVLIYIGLKYNLSLHLKTQHFRTFTIQLIRRSWPLGLMLVFNLLYAKIDVVLLSFYKPPAEVGIYGVSYRFFEVAIALPAFLANSTFPLLLQHAQDTKKYTILFKKYLLLYSLLAIAATIIMFIFSPIISILKGQFHMSILPLQILTLSLPFFFLTSLLQWHFLIKNKLIFLVPLYGGALLLNLVLNIIFIPTYSYFASAVITGLCEALVFVVMLWYFRKTI